MKRQIPFLFFITLAFPITSTGCGSQGDNTSHGSTQSEADTSASTDIGTGETDRPSDTSTSSSTGTPSDFDTSGVASDSNDTSATKDTDTLSDDNTIGQDTSDTLSDDSTIDQDTDSSCDDTECKSYEYVYSEFGPCSVPCGVGTRSRTATCVDTDGIEVDPSLCGPAELTETCEGPPCTYELKYGDFGECSVSCGEGVRTRTADCIRVIDGAKVEAELCSEPVDLSEPCIGENCQYLQRLEGNYDRLRMLGVVDDKLVFEWIYFDAKPAIHEDVWIIGGEGPATKLLESDTNYDRGSFGTYGAFQGLLYFREHNWMSEEFDMRVDDKVWVTDGTVEGTVKTQGVASELLITNDLINYIGSKKTSVTRFDGTRRATVDTTSKSCNFGDTCEFDRMGVYGDFLYYRLKRNGEYLVKRHSGDMDESGRQINNLGGPVAMLGGGTYGYYFRQDGDVFVNSEPVEGISTRFLLESTKGISTVATCDGVDMFGAQQEGQWHLYTSQGTISTLVDVGVVEAARYLKGNGCDKGGVLIEYNDSSTQARVVGRLYPDGTVERLMEHAGADKLQYVGDQIYFLAQDENELYHLWRLSLSANDAKPVSLGVLLGVTGDSITVQSSDRWLFISDSQSIWRYDLSSP